MPDDRSFIARIVHQAAIASAGLFVLASQPASAETLVLQCTYTATSRTTAADQGTLLRKKQGVAYFRFYDTGVRFDIYGPTDKWTPFTAKSIINDKYGVTVQPLPTIDTVAIGGKTYPSYSQLSLDLSGSGHHSLYSHVHKVLAPGAKATIDREPGPDLLAANRLQVVESRDIVCKKAENQEHYPALALTHPDEPIYDHDVPEPKPIAVTRPLDMTDARHDWYYLGLKSGRGFPEVWLLDRGFTYTEDGVLRIATIMFEYDGDTFKPEDFYPTFVDCRTRGVTGNFPPSPTDFLPAREGSPYYAVMSAVCDPTGNTPVKNIKGTDAQHLGPGNAATLTQLFNTQLKSVLDEAAKKQRERDKNKSDDDDDDS